MIVHKNSWEMFVFIMKVLYANKRSIHKNSVIVLGFCLTFMTLTSNNEKNVQSSSYRFASLFLNASSSIASAEESLGYYRTMDFPFIVLKFPRLVR